MVHNPKNITALITFISVSDYDKMDSLTSQWLDALGLEQHAEHFASRGFVTLGACAQITENDLERIGITRPYTFAEEASRLSTMSEEEVVQDLPVSVLRTDPIVMFSSFWQLDRPGFDTLLWGNVSVITLCSC